MGRSPKCDDPYCPACVRHNLLMLLLICVALGTALKSAIWGTDRYSLAAVAATYTLVAIVAWRGSQQRGLLGLPLAFLFVGIVATCMLCPPLSRTINRWLETEREDARNSVRIREAKKPPRKTRKTATAAKAGRFTVGEAVSFPNPEDKSRLTGIVSRVNKRSISIITGVGKEWRVSTELVRRERKPQGAGKLGQLKLIGGTDPANGYRVLQVHAEHATLRELEQSGADEY